MNCSFDQLRMLPGPRWHAPAKPVDAVPKSEAVATNRIIDAVLSEAIRPLAKVTLLKPSEVYCDQDCPVVQDGVWLFPGTGHFTVAGAQRMGTGRAAVREVPIGRLAGSCRPAAIRRCAASAAAANAGDAATILVAASSEPCAVKWPSSQASGAP